MKLRSLCRTGTSRLHCPRDGLPLGSGELGGVRLDLCLGCHGLWIDEKQLRLLAERRPERMAVTDGVPGDDCPDMDEVVFDLVMSIGH